ncbi:MAG: phosphonopyruvate decarboxylase [Methylophilaceae bacterium]|nr:phosphonopyruvate decarboxylase [Methylophilaceae bacterium]
MIKPKDFYDLLVKNKYSHFVGVPDSLLKNFCAYVDRHNKNHIIATNEGTALAIAAGQYLKTNTPSVVYLQNSGLGNLINPLLSLNDPEVYSIPCLIIIGWRGEPGIKDEPQHMKQGRVTEKMLESMEVDFSVMDAKSKIEDIIKDAIRCNKERRPYVVLVKKNTFDVFNSKKNVEKNNYPMREIIIETLLSLFPKKTHFISTTGMCSRELFEIREKYEQPHHYDFITVGSMGHAFAISLGLCTVEKKKRIVCIDGDGACLMHMGSLSLIHNVQPNNFVHIIINNGAHDSVGGQPTNAFSIDFKSLSKSCGYKHYFESKNIKQIKECYENIKTKKHSVLWHILSNKGSRVDLGRPTTSAKQNIDDFMSTL